MSVLEVIHLLCMHCLHLVLQKHCGPKCLITRLWETARSWLALEALLTRVTSICFLSTGNAIDDSLTTGYCMYVQLKPIHPLELGLVDASLSSGDLRRKNYLHSV